MHLLAEQNRPGEFVASSVGKGPTKEAGAGCSQVIENYYRSFSVVEKSGDKKAVLQYLDEDYQRNLTYVSGQGETQRITENYQSFSCYADRIIRSYQTSQIFTTIAV